MQLRDYKWFRAQPEASGAQQQLPGLIVRRLGLQDYDPIFKSMRYLAQRNIGERAHARDDEIWLLSHKPVYTQGQAGKPQHILNPAGIPVVQIDRGGQVTYHGPGQLVAYLLLNVKRRHMGVRQLVDLIEQSIVATLAELGIQASAKPEAPGVYVKDGHKSAAGDDAEGSGIAAGAAAKGTSGDAKIAALGLRIRNGLSYHGLSLNVNMDLGPFANINPCGFENLAVTQIKDLVSVTQAELDSGELMRRVSRLLTDQLLERLGYQAHYRLQEAS